VNHDGQPSRASNHLKSANHRTPWSSTNSTTSVKRYLALSGGGWNAHSSHAGLLAGAMDVLEKTFKDKSIDNLLGRVEKLSSSSGGTWFSTHLAYTDAYRSQFESKQGRDSYTTTGYNGQLRKIFEGLGFNKDGSIKTPPLSGPAKIGYNLLKSGIDTAIATASKITGVNPQSIKSGLDTVLFTTAMAVDTLKNSGVSWLGYVNNYVNKPLNLGNALQGLTMNSQRMPWAQDVDLILPGAMQTSKQTLGTDKQFGRSSRATHRAVMTQPVSPPGHFVPVSLISTAATTPNGSPSGKAIFPAGGFTSVYQSESLFNKSKPIQKTIPSTLANQLSITTASAVSSAAAGMMAGPIALTSSLFESPSLPKLAKSSLQFAQDNISDFVADLAPAVSINNGVLGDAPALTKDQHNIKKVADSGLIRMADSGYVDNSSVAFLLKDIQDTDGPSQPFHITLWMQSNQKADPVTGLKSRVRIGPDARQLSDYGLASEIPLLFGQSKGDGTLDSDPIIHSASPKGLPIFAPSAKVFDESAWYGKLKADWSYSKDNIELTYFKLPVKTVENKTFGLKAGQSGVLHLFSATNPESAPAPLSFANLNEYDQNYNVIRDAIANHGGFEKLQDAFGLAA